MDPAELSAKYHGETAATYDRERRATPGWQRQQEAVEAYLATLAPGTTVLDVPVGTGRFLAAYERQGLDAVGVDVSAAMLAEARAAHPNADLRDATIFALPFDDASFDVVVCVRFLNWIREPAFSRALGELARVSRRAIVAHIKTYARTRELSLPHLVRQWRHRLYTRRHHSPHAYHERRLVTRALDEHGLQVQDVIHDPLSRHGVRSRIYVLTHQPGS